MDKSVSDKGTELEANQTEAEVADQVFSDAFDVAEKMPDDHVDSTMDSRSDNKDGDSGASDDSKGTKEDGKSGDDKTKTDGDDKTKVTALDDKTKTDSQAAEDFEQKWRSLNGVLKSRDEKHATERSEMLGEIDSLKKTISDLTGKIDNKKGKDAKDSKSIFDDLDDATKSALEEYEKDFDSVSKMEGIKRDKALSKLKAEILEEFGNKTKDILEQLTNRVAPIEKTIEANDKNTHFSIIRDSHSDFEIYRDNGSILKWIETKPKYMQDAMKAIYSEGEARDVVDLISDFKRENGLLENDNKTASSDAIAEASKRKAEKKQNLTAVTTKHTAVNTSHTAASGFDEAFDEAVSRS